jgi:uncharacterized OB-fold protein
MAETARNRVPIKPGFFTIPADPNEAPKIVGTRCNDCSEHFYPRRAICAKCMSANTTEVEMDGRGTLYSYTFVHFPMFGSSNVEVAEGYGVGQVDLAAGPRMQMPLAGKQDEFRIGQPLIAELARMREEGDNDVMIVRFRPA